LFVVSVVCFQAEVSGAGMITRPEESYRLWCVVLCDLETSSRMRRSWPALGCSAIGKYTDKHLTLDFVVKSLKLRQFWPVVVKIYWYFE